MDKELFTGFSRFLSENFGINLSEDNFARFEVFFEELLEWNKKLNLTRITGKQEVFYQHFADSLAAAAAFKYKGVNPGEFKGRVVDVGAGAGFPSLPVKIIFPGMNLSVLESKAKKTRFIESVAGKLGITGLKVLNMDAGNCGEKYDFVFTRALAKTEECMKIISRLVGSGGHAFMWITEKQKQELSGYGNLLEKLGFEVAGYTGYSLPGVIQRRYVCILGKPRKSFDF